MLKKIIDYSKTQIYKIRRIGDNSEEYIYVGHTTNWDKRKEQHQCSCNYKKELSYNTKKYIHIRENGGWSQWEMVWIQDYPCNSKREAEEKENEWIDFYKAKLNTNKSFITEEQRKERNRNYHHENKERILKQKREYYQQNKSKKKEYYENNKMRILQYSKDKYKRKKNNINN